MSSHPPRPLHLASNSVTQTPTKDAFSSPSPPSSFRHPKRYSMAAMMSSPSPPTQHQTSAQIKAARRQSSIGYFPPDSTESPRRGSLIRRKSLGTLNDSSGERLSGEGGGSWTGAGDRSSTMSLPTSIVSEPSSMPDTPVRERPPLTLTEKHADLLRFIAQKESKCLELRSQLVMHEAELSQLKRKWERIVNKGLDRDVNSAFGSGNNDSSSVVLEGIREGVQGVSRLLAAGFSVSSATPSSPTASTTQAKAKPRPLSLTHSLIHKSHSPKESDSSISTHATSQSTTTTTTRFSQSSLSSFGEELGGAAEQDHANMEDLNEGENSHTNDDLITQILMVRDTGATPTMSPNPEFHHQQNQKRRQTLGNQQQASPARTHNQSGSRSPSPVPAPTNLVGDLEGETWTSEVQPTTTKAHRRKSREVARLDFGQLDFSTLSPSVLLSPPRSASRDSGMSPGSSPRLGGSPSPAYLEGAKINGTSVNRNMRRSNSSSSMSGLAPMSSIPGLGSIAAGVSVPPPPVGSWMDSMGKKLGQLQRSSTFTKSQKRASLLLADMSHSIVNVLVPSPSATPSISVSASASGTPSSMKSSNLSLPSISPNPSTSGSLLDDEDEETMKFGTAVLQPIASPSAPAKKEEVVGKELGKEDDDDDEDWNW